MPHYPTSYLPFWAFRNILWPPTSQTIEARTFPSEQRWSQQQEHEGCSWETNCLLCSRIDSPSSPHTRPHRSLHHPQGPCNVLSHTLTESTKLLTHLCTLKTQSKQQVVTPTLALVHSTAVKTYSNVPWVWSHKHKKRKRIFPVQPLRTLRCVATKRIVSCFSFKWKITVPCVTTITFTLCLCVCLSAWNYKYVFY